MEILRLIEMIRYKDGVMLTYEKRSRCSTPIRKFDTCIELVRKFEKH